MMSNDASVSTMPPVRPVQMSEELLAMLRQRVTSRYYDQPQVVDVIARAILISRGIYP